MNRHEGPNQSRNDKSPLEHEYPFLSRPQRIIIATGLDLEAHGLEWWSAREMVAELRAQKLLGRMFTSKAYIDMAKLNEIGMLDSTTLVKGVHEGKIRKLLGARMLEIRYKVSDRGQDQGLREDRIIKQGIVSKLIPTRNPA